jgi:hypothetical protein
MMTPATATISPSVTQRLRMACASAFSAGVSGGGAGSIIALV